LHGFSATHRSGVGPADYSIVKFIVGTAELKAADFSIFIVTEPTSIGGRAVPDLGAAAQSLGDHGQGDAQGRDRCLRVHSPKVNNQLDPKHRGMPLMVVSPREVFGALCHACPPAWRGHGQRVRGLEIDAWRQAGVYTGRRQRRNVT
jgi:hypothetical protein